MKKIIFVTAGLVSGGAERVLSTIANGLSRRDYDVEIISKQHIPPFYNLDDDIKIFYPKNKITYTNHFLKYFTRFLLYKDIFLKLRKEEPEIVVTFSTTTNGIIILISKILGIKVIASEHSNYKVGLKNPFIWMIKRVIYKFSDRLTVLTKRDNEKFYGKFIKNITVMPNPLSLNPINTNSKFKRENTLLAIGNLSRWKIKGFDNLLLIFNEIQKLVPNYKLQIVGGGDSSFLAKLSNELGISNKVEFIGEVSDIQNYMQKASIFVLTSRWEGLPMALIESMSQGLPVVAYDCFSGPRDVISCYKDGILVKDQARDLFVKEVVNLIHNKKLRFKLAVEAIKTVKKYDIDSIIDRWELIINNIQID